MRQLLIAFAVFGTCILTGCSQPDAAPANRSTDLPSGHYLLLPDDLKHFQPGRATDDVLKDVRWRGNFKLASDFDGHAVSGIYFEVAFLEGQKEAGSDGEALYAIFVDDKFVKFVRWFPDEMIQIPYEGSTRSEFKPITIGDIDWLIRAGEAKPANIEDVEKEVKARPPIPSQVDPGLTIAFVLSGVRIEAPTADDYKRNALMRDKFNAARLDLGMTEAEVENVFQSKPLFFGEVEAGLFKVYGSDEFLTLGGNLGYTNVLVVFTDGKLSTIYGGIPAGPEWRKSLEELFVDFPKQKQ
jgi:hypothetical protein